MEATKILSMDILDLLFEGRNKEYGAYELRKTYARRIKRALLITFSFVLLVVAGALFANGDDHQAALRPKITDMTLEKIEEEEEVKPPPVLPPPQLEQPPVQTMQFTPPQIVPDEDVQQPPPEQTDLLDVKIDVLDRDGIKDLGIVAPAIIDDGKGVFETKKANPEEIFTKVEVEASFKGGDKEWIKYLERNLNPNAPVDNGAPAGVYNIIVQFVVSKNGVISDVRALTSYGYGMEEEAVRVIRKGPDWVAAVQNGNKVSAYRKQPITFKVEE